jgi:hypothetical protein
MLGEVSMKLPAFNRILREDLREAPTWIDKVIYPVNSFFENAYNALNKGLTFEENISSQIKDLSIVTTAAYDGTAAHWTMVTFQSSLKRKAKGLLLLQIVQVGSVYAPIEGDVYVDWEDQNGQIRIGLVRGLSASKSYQMRVLLI